MIATRHRPELLPALTLFLLSPLIGEYLLGNISIDMLWLLPLLALLYGSGALLVRETALRLGAGWVGILLLAVAYGVVEEGFVTQSLFDPDFMGQRLLDYGHIPALGIGAWWTVLVLTLHTVWSIAAAIALGEGLWPRRASMSWLPGLSYPAVGLMFVIGCVAVARVSGATAVASLAQLGATAAVAALLLAGSWLIGRRRDPGRKTSSRPVPPRAAGLVAFLLLSPFLITTWTMEVMPAPLNVGIMVAILALLALLVWRWSRRSGWGLAQRLGLAAGALLTYGWWSIMMPPHVTSSDPSVDLAGNLLFLAGALVLLAIAYRRIGRNLEDGDG